MISQELLFFFSALGAFNGLLLSLYFLFFAKPKHISNFFLGAFIFSLSIRIGKSVVFYFNTDLAFHFLQFGLTACFFIGPFLYFYIKSIQAEENNIQQEWKYHMCFLVPAILIFGLVFPFESNVDLWRPYAIWGIYGVWFLYSIAAGYYLKDTVKEIFSKSRETSVFDYWVIGLFTGNLLIWAAFKFCGFTSYILGALIFSFMFYILLMLFVFRNKSGSILFKKEVKYADKKISDSESTALISSLKEIVEENKMFKQPNLKLSDVAKKLNITPHKLSQLLNDNLNVNFSQFLKEYRISEAKQILSRENNFTFEGIGYECGFNSKSSFYAAFKQNTGLTPAKYAEKFSNKDH